MSGPRPSTVDVAISAGGTVYLFHLVTPRARAWVEEHISDDHQMLGTSLAVEHRYAAGLAAGMQDDGLIVRDEES